jgi:hypothetical protein
VSHTLAQADIPASSNSRCAMEIQYLEEIQDNTVAIEDDTNASITHFNTETSGRITQSDWEDAFPMDLAISSKTEEGPEVFKRVRFLSRWEFRHESRGILRYQVDQYSWWRAVCPEAMAMKQVVAGTFERKKWSSSGPIRSSKWEKRICIGLFFVGKTLQQSIPVLVIFSMDKKQRREACKFLADLDWIRAHPLLALLTTCHSVFHPGVKKFHQRKREITT